MLIPLAPIPLYNLGRQRGIQLPFQFRQVFDPQLVIEIAAHSLRLDDPQPIRADRLERPAIGGDAEQDVIQVGGRSEIALSFERQIVLQQLAGFIQHFLIAQCEGMIGHELALLGWLRGTNNLTRFGQARQIFRCARPSGQIWIY